MGYKIRMKILLGVGILLLGLGAPVQAATDFAEWVRALKVEAQSRGIDSALLERAFENVEPLPRVLELDRKQPEFTMSFEEYASRIVSPARVESGRQKMAQHRETLESVSAQYGVPSRYLVALWGIETQYGKQTGGFNVIESLATLAFDGRRSRYFREELLNALQIVQEGHIPLAEMKGSWAGAMGQCQFMPSSFLSYAVDADGDGRKDIWNTEADVFASAANYLARSGWRREERWGRPVRLPKEFDGGMAEITKTKSLDRWTAMGVRRANGGILPAGSMEGAIVLPDGNGGPAYLVYDNFRVIMKWNRSTYFATSVGLLADALM
jgi:membrane-bound lytic murein transglycosylase B